MRSKQISINVGETTYTKLADIAKQEGRSLSNYVAAILFKHVANLNEVTGEPIAPVVDKSIAGWAIPPDFAVDNHEEGDEHP